MTPEIEVGLGTHPVGHGRPRVGCRDLPLSKPIAQQEVQLPK
jgi:hypothetical protein